ILSIWRVKDDGVGIPPELRPTLFQPFARGHSDTTTRSDGSGLGLYIARTSIELLGGSIQCDDAPGGGTIFTIRLPLDVAPAPVAQAPSVARPVHLDRLRQKSLLIAEDHDLIAEILAARLNRQFGRVTVVSDGESALAKMAQDPHDAVLTDLFMPRMGGDILTRHLRDRGYGGPILGMSAAAVGDERALFESAGTTDVLTKPVVVSDLLDRLARALG
ncbi:MAG: response regulator, partial [Rhodobacteraceae bacterium]|nr:response regulator [Paracoccaceae bacterium]